MQTEDFFIEAVPGEAFPHRTPFDLDGDCEGEFYFFYLSNRTFHRWTYLLTRIDHGYELSKIIPMGYSQLWTFQLLHTVQPTHTRMKSAQHLKPRELPGVPSRGNWIGKVHMVLQQPHRQHPTSDLVAICPDRDSAIDVARQYAQDYGRPAVVALILGDEQWH